MPRPAKNLFGDWLLNIPCFPNTLSQRYWKEIPKLLLYTWPSQSLPIHRLEFFPFRQLLFKILQFRFETRLSSNFFGFWSLNHVATLPSNDFCILTTSFFQNFAGFWFDLFAISLWCEHEAARLPSNTQDTKLKIITTKRSGHLSLYQLY